MKQYLYTCKDNRVRLITVDNNGVHSSKSYPRILMEKKLGRKLLPNEDVHHIDGNPLNNSLDNLEIILHGEHQKNHSTKLIDTIERCVICGKEFTMSHIKWSRLFSDLKRGKNRTLTCCKSCCGKASSGKYDQLYDVNDRFLEIKKLQNIND